MPGGWRDKRGGSVGVLKKDGGCDETRDSHKKECQVESARLSNQKFPAFFCGWSHRFETGKSKLKRASPQLTLEGVIEKSACDFCFCGGSGLLGSGVGFLLLVGKHLPHPGFVLHG